jgi:predicted transcriptional regulator of viral defense system
VAKRLGYLVEALNIPGQAERLAHWQSLISQGISPLEPGAGNLGPVRSRWQLRVNVSIAEKESPA